MRVLVVDDDAPAREVLRTGLEARGHEVVTAADGSAALEAARAESVDAVVSDILMPGMDGYRLCMEWRSDEALRRIPFLFYSGTYTSPEDEEFALGLGADAFMVKPEDMDVIADRLVAAAERTGGEEVRRPAPTGEADVLREYNERLIRKLEDKLEEIERSNEDLRRMLDLLTDEVAVKSRLIDELNAELGDAERKAGSNGLLRRRVIGLEDENADLRRTQEGKTLFLARVGHQLRVPLNSIIGFAGILQQGLAGDLNEEQRRQVDMIYASGRSLLALVNDVVDISKIEAGITTLSVAAFELLGLLDRIVESMRGLAEEEGTSLALEAPPGVIAMTTDPAKVETVVRHLLSNAVKYSPGGSVTVTVTAVDEDAVAMTFSDTGRGIPEERLPTIFEGLSRLTETEVESSGGTGLGLAITHALCEMLGGSVSARSRPGEGSSFTVVLPRRIAPESAEPGP